VTHRTLREVVTVEGVGLHSGRPCRVRVVPREEPGLAVRGPSGPVPLSLRAVEADERRTQAAGVATLEHLLAALYVAGVSAAELVVEGGEVPAGDGSARVFWEAVQAAGTRPLQAPRPELRVTDPVWVREGVRMCAAFPGDGLRVTYVVDFRDRPAQALDVAVTPETFAGELAAARTWGYREEAAALRAAGLALGATEQNTLVLEDGGYRNPPRFPDEPVRHKVVDLVGDLALLGAQVHAHVVAVRAGHRTHLALARRLEEATGTGSEGKGE
jgi:UDP-3-O-[3-hydroxymyristoyl] N-acetylglucosamine deacetylase